MSERCEFLLSKALRRLAQVVAEHARLEAETVCEKADAMHGRTLMTGPTNLSAEKIEPRKPGVGRLSAALRLDGPVGEQPGVE